ncbi:FkbM family methyltransferase [Sphingomonas sp. ID0503]|uniref:FkbM family methyltransferase n=1 Tax=Sphingomonas sp. ID0503 TaxID=3399691 RepID=UPI003AFABA13
MGLAAIPYHLTYIRHQLGQKLKLGDRPYRVRGYITNRLTTTATHEPHLVAALARAMAARSGTVIDVGVNTGQTLQKILSIDAARHYVGFEPQVGCCFFVDQFLRDNKVRNASVVSLALSNSNMLLPLYSEGQFDEMASLVASTTSRYRAESAVTYVPARIGDEVLREMSIDDPAIIKVDVEGAEISVFRGLSGTLAEKRPICFFEVLPNYAGHDRVPIDVSLAERNRAAAADLYAFFAEAGYRIHQIDQAGGEAPIDAFDLDRPDAFVGTDYVAHPA